MSDTTAAPQGSTVTDWLLRMLEKMKQSVEKWTTYVADVAVSEDGEIHYRYASPTQIAISRVVGATILGTAIAFSFMPDLDPRLTQMVDDLMRTAARL